MVAKAADSKAAEPKPKKVTGNNKPKSKVDEASQLAEEAKNKLIAERNRQDQDDAKAGMFQPHVMNDEERTAWKEYVDGITQFYGEIIMRQ
jgi:hypothetical protein